MTIDVSDLLTFAEVVARGGFSAAARSLGTTRQSVHREVTRLERALGTRLFERTTRKVRPTEAGSRLYTHAERIRSELRAATDALHSLESQPAGTLRVASPVLFGEEILEPVVARFVERYPQTRVEMLHRMGREDFMGAELDVAIRMGSLPDSSLVSRRLGYARMLCCTSTDYLERAPEPLCAPSDLLRHATLHYGQAPRDARVTWNFVADGDEQAISVLPRLASTSSRVVRRACRRGLGICRLPSLAVERGLASGELVEVLPRWRSPREPIHALMAGRAGDSPARAAFVELLRDHMAKQTWLDRNPSEG